MAIPDGSTGYCAIDGRGGECSETDSCPAGEFCTIFNPPKHCVTACLV
jgi:hypothetical protein